MTVQLENIKMGCLVTQRKSMTRSVESHSPIFEMRLSWRLSGTAVYGGRWCKKLRILSGNGVGELIEIKEIRLKFYTCLEKYIFYYI